MVQHDNLIAETDLIITRKDTFIEERSSMLSLNIRKLEVRFPTDDATL